MVVLQVHARGDRHLTGCGAAIFHQHEELKVVKAEGVGKGLVHGWWAPYRAVAEVNAFLTHLAVEGR